MKMNHQRAIPGQEVEEGREFLYVECGEEEGYETSQVASRAFNAAPVEERPTAGGVLDERVFITDSNRRRFMGISYRGDIQAWRRAIIGLCKTQDRSWGHVQGDTFIVTGEEPVPFGSCSIEFV